MAACAKEVENPKAMTERQLDRLLMTTIGFLPSLSLAWPQGNEEMNWAAQKQAACIMQPINPKCMRNNFCPRFLP